jgi:hypothetical protein
MTYQRQEPIKSDSTSCIGLNSISIDWILQGAAITPQLIIFLPVPLQTVLKFIPWTNVSPICLGAGLTELTWDNVIVCPQSKDLHLWSNHFHQPNKSTAQLWIIHNILSGWSS